MTATLNISFLLIGLKVTAIILSNQCDQMAKLYVRNLVIYQDDNLADSINFAKVCTKLCQLLIKPSKTVKDFSNFAKSGHTASE